MSSIYAPTGQSMWFKLPNNVLVPRIGLTFGCICSQLMNGAWTGHCDVYSYCIWYKGELTLEAARFIYACRIILIMQMGNEEAFR